MYKPDNSSFAWVFMGKENTAAGKDQGKPTAFKINLLVFAAWHLISSKFKSGADAAPVMTRRCHRSS